MFMEEDSDCHTEEASPLTFFTAYDSKWGGRRGSREYHINEVIRQRALISSRMQLSIESGITN